MNIANNIASTIKKKRISAGLTQKELADLLCLGKNGDRTLRRWENNETSPSQIKYNAIIEFFTKSEKRPFKKVRHPKFDFIDLFAGIGGIRIPFQELGGRCIFTSEWDKFAQKTYYINFGDKPHGDITKIAANKINDFDILLAGFPCQPFSQAGLKKGFADTRGTLFFEIERIIKTKRPKAFLLENVKQLRTHDKGRTLKVILEHINSLDYTCDYNILRAGDFGIPQNRERIYIVGFDKRYYDINSLYHFSFPIPTYKKTCLKTILEKNVNPKYTISQRLYEGHIRRKAEHKRKGNGFGFSVFTPESEYVNTLSARYYKDGSEIMIDQGVNTPPRKLTPRECARLQGFPEKFIIPVSDTQAYKQFGNSVAVPVIRAIAKNIVNEMQELPTYQEIAISRIG